MPCWAVVVWMGYIGSGVYGTVEMYPCYSSPTRCAEMAENFKGWAHCEMRPYSVKAEN